MIVLITAHRFCNLFIISRVSSLSLTTEFPEFIVCVNDASSLTSNACIPPVSHQPRDNNRHRHGQWEVAWTLY